MQHCTLHYSIFCDTQMYKQEVIEKLALFNIYFRDDLNRNSSDLVQPRTLVASLPGLNMPEVFKALRYPNVHMYANPIYKAFNLPRNLEGGDIIEECSGFMLQHLVHDVDTGLIILTKKYLDQRVHGFSQESIFDAKLRVYGIPYFTQEKPLIYPIRWEP